MEKDLLENFDFLPIENTDDIDPYLLVDNNKSFLIDKVATEANQNMPFMTQVQDVDDLQMPLYSLGEQPFFMDENVASASNIVLPEQLVVPNVKPSDVFTENFFIQQSTEPIVTELTNVKPEFGNCDPNMQVTIENPVEGAPCTEITLTEEQCQMLEQKGWVLLDLNNRVYLIDSAGAHDITNNEKMIERYRDLENNLEKEIEEDLTYIKNLDLMAAQEAASMPLLETNLQENDMNVNDLQVNKIGDVFTDPIVNNERSEKFRMILKELAPKQDPLFTETPEEKDFLLTKRKPKPSPKKPKKPEPRVHSSRPRKLLKIPIKTKLFTKNVPSKVFLGIMSNGKKLYAKVKKVESKTSQLPKDKTAVNCRMVIHLSQTGEDIKELDNLEFHKEAEYALHRSSTWTEKCGAEEVKQAEKIAQKLLAAPQSLEMMHGQRLLITTCEKRRSAEDIPEYVLKSVVTGRAVERSDNDHNKCHFIHMPHLLAYIMKQKTERYAPHGVENFIIHLHISETLHELLPPQIVVTLTKRSMPLKPLTLDAIQIINVSKPKHSCTYCSEVFTTTDELKKHQKDCTKLREEDKTSALEQLMHNTLTAPIISLEMNGNKSYSCQYCKNKFENIPSYKSHMLVHLGSNYVISRETDFTGIKREEVSSYYKCNLCPDIFPKHSTLFEHIKTSHILV